MSSMNFMEKLLAGAEVEWKALGDVVRLQRGKRLIKSQLEKVGNYAVYQNCMTPLGYYHESNVKADTAFIISAGAAGEIGYSDVDFWAADDVYFFLTSDGMDSKFLYHFLLTQQNQISSQVRRASIPRLSKAVVEKLQIPIPCPENPKKSLEIQTEIVRILDTFTELTAELTTELTARKKQYNYYRDQLLSFDLPAGRQEGKACLSGRQVEWKTLDELTLDKFWIMPATPKFVDNEEVPYITSKNIHGGHIDFKKVKLISRQDYLNLSRNRPILAGDFLISMIGTIGEVARVKETDLDFYGQNMYLIRLNSNLIHSGYFLHFFDSPKMKNHFNAVKNNSGQGYLKANNIDDIRVPVPPLAEQNRIVAILDKFDALTNSISEGLPREIELRQKQYEHYRNLLLSFPKPEAANGSAL